MYTFMSKVKVEEDAVLAAVLDAVGSTVQVSFGFPVLSYLTLIISLLSILYTYM